MIHACCFGAACSVSLKPKCMVALLIMLSSDCIAWLRPDVAMAVDWSALPLYQALGTKLKQQQQQQPAAVLPMVWLNYRVFSRTSTGAELELVSRLERQAMHEAVLSVALSRSDAAYLDQHVASQQAMPSGTAEGEGRCPSTQAAKRVHVLLPALREDMRLMDAPVLLGLNGSCNGTDQGTVAHGVGNRASQSSQDMGDGHCGATAPTTSEVQAFVQSRPYLTCCVRLSSEKEPQRFVELMEELAARGALGTDGPGGLGVTPLLIGSATDEYAQGLKARLKAAAPGAVLVEKFMGPADLVEVYRRYCTDAGKQEQAVRTASRMCLQLKVHCWTMDPVMAPDPCCPRSTRLNIHPPTYDAYGMTIVEAASQGAPSLVHGGSGYAGGDGTGAVGATDLLRGSHDEVILLDLSTDVAIVAEAVQVRCAMSMTCTVLAARLITQPCLIQDSLCAAHRRQFCRILFGCFVLLRQRRPRHAVGPRRQMLLS